MATARQTAEWDRFAQLLTLTANCHRNRRRPYELADFHPYRTRRQAPRMKAPISALKSVFLHGKPYEPPP